MKLRVLRYRSREDETLGLLFDVSKGAEFLCYTLEDEHRDQKVSAETRIPAGTYKITLRNEGRHHEPYKKKFPDVYKGMLWIRDVPGFEFILIHIGNTEGDTAGCLLVGTTPTEDGRIEASAKAFKKVYTRVVDAMERGEGVEIEYIDYDSV